MIWRSPVTKVLGLKREHRFVGPEDERGHNWAVQDGIIMGWSESNVRYEEAWWLDPEGRPWKDLNTEAPVIQALLKERPFDPEWLR
jgi:hypothetical protein